MANIVVVGSYNTDMILKLAHIPQPGETVSGGAYVQAAGGKGANQAVAASRAGAQVSFVAALGMDSFGDQALQGLRADGIDVRYVARKAQISSGVAFIFVDDQGENSIGVASGANAALSAEDIRRAEPAIAKADWLLVQLETPMESVHSAIKLAQTHAVPVILNPAPACPLPEDILAAVSILTPNELEAEYLTGIQVRTAADAERAIDSLRRSGPDKVIITLGSHGVHLGDGQRQTRFPAFHVQAVDSTAAGDVFNGALAVALAEGTPLESGIRFAQAAAALAVTRLGAQSSAPTRPEIEAFLARQG